MKRKKKGYIGCAVLLVAPVLLSVALWGFGELMKASDAAHPPADAPADLCAVVGDDLAEKLVPNAVRTAEAVYSRGADAACQWNTRQPVTGDYGSLSVRILRYGQVSWEDGPWVADDEFGEDCEALVSGYESAELGGLGDEACVATDTDSTGGTAFADLVVHRGADLVWVRHHVNPGEGVDVGQRVVDVAATLLAGT